MPCCCQERKVDQEIVNVDLQPTNFATAVQCCHDEKKESPMQCWPSVPNKVASDSVMAHSKVRHSGLVV